MTVAVVLLIAASVVLLPRVHSLLTTETADGVLTYDVPGLGTPGVTVRPDEGWTVRPNAVGGGLTLQSPDRALTVRLAPAEASDASAPTPDAGAPVLTEELANGLMIRHVTTGPVFTGVVDLGPVTGSDRPLRVEAEAPDSADVQRYVLAVAQLLETIEPATATER